MSLSCAGMKELAIIRICSPALKGLSLLYPGLKAGAINIVPILGFMEKDYIIDKLYLVL